jgi:hypothetical protein
MAIAHDVIAERIQRAAEHRQARMARRARRHASRMRPVGRMLIRLGIALGGGPERPAGAATLSPVRPR